MLTKSQNILIKAWVCSVAALTLLVLFQAVSFEYYIIIHLISIILITALSGPFLSQPKWKARLYIVLIAGVLLVAIIVVNKALPLIGL